MKYCTNCGHPLKADQPFCTNCGAKQTIIADPRNVTTATTRKTSAPDQGVTAANFSHNPALWLIVGAIVVIVLGIGGYYGANTYKRNHLTEQEIADIGDGVATKYLGSDAVKVYYNKSDNQLTMVAKSGTALYDRAEDSISDYGDTDSLAPYVDKFKKISTAMSPKMPTDLQDIQVEFMNPENTSRYLYVTENGKVTYDFTTDDD